MEGITRSSSRAAATDAIRRAAPCAVAPPGPFTSRGDELCSSRRLVSRSICCARLTSATACAPQQLITEGPGRLAAPVQPAAAPAPRARHHTVRHGPLPAAGAALGLQPAASAISLASPFCQMQAEDGGNYTIEQQSSDNRCDSSRCTMRSSSARPIYLQERRAVQQ